MSDLQSDLIATGELRLLPLSRDECDDLIVCCTIGIGMVRYDVNVAIVEALIKKLEGLFNDTCAA